MMKGIVARNGRCQLLSNIPIPTPGKGQVLVKVHATAMNRADTLQRMGKYPPPPGTTEVLGLELAGKICGKGPETKHEVDVEVMALVSGGAFAEYCVVDEGALMKVPKGLDIKQAACVPEVYLTAFQLLHLVGGLKKSDCVLIHAGASGVGTAAIQLAKFAGVENILVTTSEKKLSVCESLGATKAYDRNLKWDEEVLKHSKPVSLILDCIGASYAEQNVKVLDTDGRWVLFGLMGGPATPESLFTHILRKRLAILGSTLRTRSVEYKEMLVSSFVKAGCLDALGNGTLKVVKDDKSFDGLEQVNDALDHMETNASIGKIALIVSKM